MHISLGGFVAGPFSALVRVCNKMSPDACHHASEYLDSVMRETRITASTEK